MQKRETLQKHRSKTIKKFGVELYNSSEWKYQKTRNKITKKSGKIFID